MGNKEKFDVPKGFLDLFKERKDTSGLSLRQISTRAGISVSFLSRILLGDRGLPSNDIILRIADVLEIIPPEKLLVEAGRAPKKTVPLLRASSKLTAKDLDKVTKLATKLANQKSRQKKSKK